MQWRCRSHRQPSGCTAHGSCGWAPPGKEVPRADAGPPSPRRRRGRGVGRRPPARESGHGRHRWRLFLRARAHPRTARTGRGLSPHSQRHLEENDPPERRRRTGRHRSRRIRCLLVLRPPRSGGGASYVRCRFHGPTKKRRRVGSRRRGERGGGGQRGKVRHLCRIR